MSVKNNINRILFILVISSVIIRAILAGILELTNDEVNYWLYAMFPDWSHYEHPPMVGYFIQITTLNLHIDNEFFMRLSSVLLGGFNTYIIFLIGKKIKDELTGLFAALLFTSSLYCFIISGVFIHPDTPMVFFWLLSLYFLVDGLFFRTEDKFNISILLAGLFIGLGMLSKYIILALWAGLFIYIIFYDRKWLKRKEVYFSVIISAICFLPVIIWNLQNEADTVSFWDGNIKMLRSGIKPDFFFQELAGQFFYNNPVNFILIVTVLFAVLRKKFPPDNIIRLLILSSIPLVILVMVMSLFGKTLPHWSGGGYIGLILICAVFLRTKHMQVPKSIKLALSFAAVFIIAGLILIYYSPFDSEINLKENATNLGKHDITLDMYGWEQAAEKFRVINDRFITDGKMKPDAPIFSDKWFNAGHIDYYIANPLDKNLFAVGTISEIRKYYWVNSARGGYENVKEAYYLSPSRDYRDPRIDCSRLFSAIVTVDTIKIERRGIVVENIFVFIMKK